MVPRKRADQQGNHADTTNHFLLYPRFFRAVHPRVSAAKSFFAVVIVVVIALSQRQRRDHAARQLQFEQLPRRLRIPRQVDLQSLDARWLDDAHREQLTF